MKEQELLLKELALMLERQDMLSKLTEGKCLDEYAIPRRTVLTILED